VVPGSLRGFRWLSRGCDSYVFFFCRLRGFRHNLGVSGVDFWRRRNPIGFRFILLARPTSSCWSRQVIPVQFISLRFSPFKGRFMPVQFIQRPVQSEAILQPVQQVSGPFMHFLGYFALVWTVL
jgi:hypothetical protein